MKTLKEKLTDNEINFICEFTNRYVRQIPYINSNNVYGLNGVYFIKRLKSKLLLLSNNHLKIAGLIINKFN